MRRRHGIVSAADVRIRRTKKSVIPGEKNLFHYKLIDKTLFVFREISLVSTVPTLGGWQNL